jgi:hypothetical protein
VLPLTMGLIGIVAAAVVWVILFLVAAFTVHRGGSGFLGEWRAGHLTCVVALPLVMMICVYILPGIVGF